MKKTTKHLIKVIIAIVAITLLFVIIFLNNFKNRNFFTMDFYQIIYLCFMIFISFYLVQLKTDERKRKEILYEFVCILKNDTICITKDVVVNQPQTKFQLLSRNIENKINMLKKVMKKYEIEKEVEYIAQELQNLESTVSNHINDSKILESNYIDIERNIYNICSKCDELLYKLYF